MNRRWLLLFLFGFFSSCNDNTKEFVSAGTLEFSPAELHHKVEAGTEDVEFIYTAVNVGSDPVEVINVDSGCACIKESVEPRIIPPGGSAEIKAVYTAKRLLGLAEQKLVIKTDQHGVGEVFLKVKLEVDPIYKLDREFARWKIGEEPKTQTVVFEVLRDKPIHVVNVSVSRPEITAKVEEVAKGKKYRIHITPTTMESNMLGIVTMITDCDITAHAKPILYVKVD